MLDTAVLASGRGTNLQALLEADRADELGPASIDFVVSDNADATALDRAEKFGVEAEHLDPERRDREDYDRRLANRLRERDIGLVVLTGFMRVLSDPMLEAFRDRMINVHPAILPSFRGLDAQAQAIEKGVRIAGATTHFVTADVDEGPIILQSAVPVHPDDDEESLSRRILETEHEILPASVRLFAEDRLSIDGGRVRIRGDVDVPGRRLIVPGVTT
jgi:phosphoribosylglycinamide formyltransferase-1